MKNTFGNVLTVTLFGESHGPAIGAVVDGLAPGLQVTDASIAAHLALRRPAGTIATARVEPDAYQILSGVYNGKTTGTPLCLTIGNTNVRSGDYTPGLARPGHADYTGFCKYHGFEDPRGGGHFSARVTAALVAVGAIVLDALAAKHITVGTHIAACGSLHDRTFSSDPAGEIDRVKTMPFPLLDESLDAPMRAQIEAAKAQGDSVGGVLETAVCGMPAGVGEPWFDSVESLLSHALFSIPAVKGVEFGDGFGLAGQQGSQANDAMRLQNGKVVTVTNHNGGINGGITNGMPLVFRCAFKPTPSIAKLQQTVDYATMTETEIAVQGRHDPAVFHRAPAIVNALTALTLYDALAMRFGTDWFCGEAAL